MPEFETLRRIQRMHLGARVVALTNGTTQPMPLHTMPAGIDGYLGKDIETREFEKALYKVGSVGDTYLRLSPTNWTGSPTATCRMIPFNSYRCGRLGYC